MVSEFGEDTQATGLAVELFSLSELKGSASFMDIEWLTETRFCYWYKAFLLVKIFSFFCLLLFSNWKICDLPAEKIFLTCILATEVSTSAFASCSIQTFTEYHLYFFFKVNIKNLYIQLLIFHFSK